MNHTEKEIADFVNETIREGVNKIFFLEKVHRAIADLNGHLKKISFFIPFFICISEQFLLPILFENICFEFSILFINCSLFLKCRVGTNAPFPDLSYIYRNKFT